MRTYKIYTGTAGMERMNQAIREEIEHRNMINYLYHLVKLKKITLDEFNSLESMMNSPDKGNKVIAVEILKNRYGYVASMPNM